MAVALWCCCEVVGFSPPPPELPVTRAVEFAAAPALIQYTELSEGPPMGAKASPHGILQSLTETLLLKTPHSWVIRHGDIELVLTWKLHAHWLAFTLLEGAIRATKGESDHQPYLAATLPAKIIAILERDATHRVVPNYFVIIKSESYSFIVAQWYKWNLMPSTQCQTL